MKCKACGRYIKHENGRWWHYKKKRHYAVPDYRPYINKLLYAILLVVGGVVLSFAFNITPFTT